MAQSGHVHPNVGLISLRGKDDRDGAKGRRAALIATEAWQPLAQCELLSTAVAAGSHRPFELARPLIGHRAGEIKFQPMQMDIARRLDQLETKRLTKTHHGSVRWQHLPV